MGLRSIAKLARRPALVSTVIAAMVFIAVAALRALGALQAVELAAYDAYLRLRPASSAIDARIALVTITDQDISAIGQWPMSDATLADLVEKLLAQQARAIGLDLYRDLAVPPGSARLSTLLTSSATLVVVEKFGTGNEPAVPPPPALAGTEQVGFADLMVDPGGVVRRALLFLDDGKRVAYSLPLRLALRYLEPEGISPQPGSPDPAHLKLGSTTIIPFNESDGGYVDADDRGYQMLLDFNGGLLPFVRYTMTEILAGTLPRDALRGKLVLVGVTADSVKDLFLTPYSHDQGLVASTPGIYLHAQAARQLLRMALEGANSVRSLSEPLESLWTLVWSALGAALALLVPTLRRLLLLAVPAWLGLGGLTFGLLVSGWWLPVIPPAIALVGSSTLVIAYLSGLQRTERRFLMEIFSKHVSGDVAQEIWRQRDTLLSDGRIEAQELTVTVLFSDLENFTPIAEALSPRDLMGWLNDYMESMVSIVMAHGGVVDDFFGDAIKANFGAPLAHTSMAEIAGDATNAVACAVEMAEAMDAINNRYAAQALPPARMRIGIATGSVVAGCLGSAQRMKYTTIGDVVNTAARLQAYGKEIPASEGACTTILSADTHELLGGRFQTEFVGEASLKGKAQSVAAYRVLITERTHDVNTLVASDDARVSGSRPRHAHGGGR